MERSGLRDQRKKVAILDQGFAVALQVQLCVVQLQSASFKLTFREFVVTSFAALCTCLNLLVHNCMEVAEHRWQLQNHPHGLQCPKAIQVPTNASGVIPMGHSIQPCGQDMSQWKAGVGAYAWQNCHQLQIVKPPATVPRLKKVLSRLRCTVYGGRARMRDLC